MRLSSGHRAPRHRRAVLADPARRRRPKCKACNKSPRTESEANSKANATSSPVAVVGVAGVEEEDADEPEPLYAQLSFEVRRGRQSAGRAASTNDAQAVPSGGHHRSGSLLAFHGSERADSVVSSRLRRRIWSAHP